MRSDGFVLKLNINAPYHKVESMAAVQTGNKHDPRCTSSSPMNLDGSDAIVRSREKLKKHEIKGSISLDFSQGIRIRPYFSQEVRGI
jgi:hypothetical protein